MRLAGYIARMGEMHTVVDEKIILKYISGERIWRCEPHSFGSG